MQPYRNRTVPYKLLASILYGAKEGIVTKAESGCVILKTGKMARNLMVSNSRLIEAIEWLKATGIFVKVDYPIRGTAIIYIKESDIFSNEQGS